MHVSSGLLRCKAALTIPHLPRAMHPALCPWLCAISPTVAGVCLSVLLYEAGTRCSTYLNPPFSDVTSHFLRFWPFEGRADCSVRLLISGGLTTESMVWSHRSPMLTLCASRYGNELRSDEGERVQRFEYECVCVGQHNGNQKGVGCTDGRNAKGRCRLSLCMLPHNVLPSVRS